MTRAEEKALRAYPIPQGTTPRGRAWSDEDMFYVRKPYIEGYEQAEKDTIERAIAWLKEHASDYIVNCTESYPDAPFRAVVGEMCWEDLREYLEDEGCQG